MKILKNVVVKQLLTEKSKQELVDKFQAQYNQLHKEIEQLRFEKKKIEKSKDSQKHSAAIQIEKEIDNRQEKQKLLHFKKEQIDLLPIGSELKETEVQSVIEVNVGDNWEEVVKGGTIVIKDGVIHEIR